MVSSSIGPSTVHRGTRQQRRVHLEGRVLGGGADEGEEASHMRREGVLLALLKRCTSSTNTMVGRPAAGPPGPFHRLPDLLDAAQHGRDLQELGPAGWAMSRSDGGLAHAGGPHKDHRVQLARLGKPRAVAARRPAGGLAQ